LEQRKGGQVIDLRPGAPKAFYRTPDVVYGTVVIVTVDGKVTVEVVTVEVREPEGMFGKVVSTLPQLLSSGRSAEEVTRTVTERFGADIAIETADIAVETIDGDPAPEGGA
jgi:RNA binding exosome subunit